LLLLFFGGWFSLLSAYYWLLLLLRACFCFNGCMAFRRCPFSIIFLPCIFSRPYRIQSYTLALSRLCPENHHQLTHPILCLHSSQSSSNTILAVMRDAQLDNLSLQTIPVIFSPFSPLTLYDFFFKTLSSAVTASFCVFGVCFQCWS